MEGIRFLKEFSVYLTSSPFFSITPTPSGSYTRSSGGSEGNNFFLGLFVRSSGSMKSCQAQIYGVKTQVPIKNISVSVHACFVQIRSYPTFLKVHGERGINT